MSIAASNWVWSLSVGDATRKLVLLRFADHAHDDGTAAWCGIKSVARFAECSERTAQRAVKWLLENGYMREGDQRHVDHIEPKYRPIVYDLAMSTETAKKWALLHAAGGNTRREVATSAGKKGAERRAEIKAANPQVSRGDNLTPLETDANPQVSRGDNLSPLETGVRGDAEDVSGVTPEALRGDTGVTQTTQEPPSKNQKTSSSEPLRGPDAESPEIGSEPATPPANVDPVVAAAVERICEHLATRLRENDVVPKPIGKRWRDAARLMMTRDGRSETQIHNMIDWATNDSFWRANILSMPTLREKYDQMRLRALEETQQGGGSARRYDDVKAWGVREGTKITHASSVPLTAEELDAVFGPSPSHE